MKKKKIILSVRLIFPIAPYDREIWIVLGVIGAVAAVLLGAYFFLAPASIPDKIEPLGPLQLVTHTTSYLGGWNQGHLGWGTTEHYSIRYHNAPFSFEGRAGMFGGGKKDYGTSKKSGLRIEHLTDVSGGAVYASMLDATAEKDNPKYRDVAVHRRHYATGRYLLLGTSYVLDTTKLEGHKIEFNGHTRTNSHLRSPCRPIATAMRSSAMAKGVAR